MDKRHISPGGLLRGAATVALGVCLTLLGPSLAVAQQAPGGPATLTPGPGAVGDASQMIGHVDTPSSGAAFYPGADIGLTGWAVDTTAQGSSGFDQVQVYLGQMGSGGTLLGQGSVGLPRPDIAQATGSANAGTAGFQITATGYPGLSQVSGPVQLNVYLHSPTRGWWLLPASVTLNSTTAVQEQSLQNGIVVTGAYLWGKSLLPEPLPNAVLSDKRGNYHIIGFAFDTSHEGTLNNGIASVDVSLDGDSSNPDYVDLGLATLGDQGGQPTPHGYPPGAGFNLTVDTSVWNWAGLQLGQVVPWPTGQHTLHFLATSISGQVAQATAPIIVTQDSDVP